MSIVNFYTNHEIFITGGSGFMGKALIEKLLRDLPNVGKIFVLLRSKKNKNSEQRLQEMLKTPTFRRAFAAHPEAFQKMVAITGDCQEKGLGISLPDLEKIRNVSLIFHAAASVRFDDELKDAILLNTRGTHELIKIAENLPNLKAFIHVSTSYAYPDIHTLEEKVYPSNADWRTAIEMAEKNDTEILNVIFPKYARVHPNTYSFTKSLSEQIINDYQHKLPLAICRPSVVWSSINEPFPGWADNFNSSMGVILTGAAGLMRTGYGDPDIIVDCVPVDLCTMAFLLAAFKVATQPTCDGKLEVFNCSNPTKTYWYQRDIIEKGQKSCVKYPLENMLWYPDGSLTLCFPWHYIKLMLLQVLPSAVLDCIYYLTKKKPFLLRVQRSLYATNSLLRVYWSTEWIFINDKLKALDTLIPNDERRLFSFMQYENFDLDHYFLNWMKGAKEFLLREKPESSEKAHLRYKIFKFLHFGIQFIGGFYIIRYFL